MIYKKCLAFCLCLLLAFASPAAVFAVDFEEWGTMDKWTDEQWEESDSWTEDEWDQYYEYADLIYQRETRKEYGLTNLTGINVLVNGECLDFGTTTPRIVEGSTMVPFRIIFESFGAEVSYSDADGVQTVRATLDGTALSLTIGSTRMMVSRDGEAETVTLSVAPFIAGGSTFLPLRAISESMGYKVLWNSWYDIAEIINPAAFISMVDAKFSIYNRLITDNLPDLTKTYETTGNFDMRGTLYGDAKDDVVTLKGNATSLQSGFNYNMKGSFQLDTRDISDSLLPLLPEELQDVVKSMSNVPFEAIWDNDEQIGYITTPLAATIENLYEDPPLYKATDWFSSSLGLDYLGNPFDFLGIDSSDGMVSLGNILYDSTFADLESVWTVNLYQQTLESLALLEILDRKSVV